MDRGFRELGDAALVTAVRRGEAGAIDEFLERFQDVVMSQAKLMRIPRAEWRTWTADLLCDVAVGLMGKTISTPRSISAYLVAAARNKGLAAQRAWSIQERSFAERSTDVGGGERTLATVCSESSVRATYSPDWEPAPLPPVLDRLVSAMEGAIDSDERELLSWVAQRTSFSTIARMLGEQRSAIVKRVTRLRMRLVNVALRFGAGLETSERAELVRFLRRTGAYDEAALDAVARGDKTILEYRIRRPRLEPSRRGGHP